MSSSVPPAAGLLDQYNSLCGNRVGHIFGAAPRTIGSRCCSEPATCSVGRPQRGRRVVPGHTAQPQWIQGDTARVPGWGGGPEPAKRGSMSHASVVC